MELKQVTIRRLEVAIKDACRLLGARTPLQQDAIRGLVEETLRLVDLDADEPDRPLPPSQSGSYPIGFEPPEPGPWEHMKTPTNFHRIKRVK